MKKGIEKLNITINTLENIKYKINNILFSESDTDIFAMSVWIKVGGINENTQYSGISHLLEHMIFQGTENNINNINYNSSEDVYKEFDLKGAIFNAQTNRDYTMYYICCLNNFIDMLVPVLLNLIFNPKLTQETLTQEKAIVIQEVDSKKSNPLFKAMHCFETNIFKNYILSQDVGGSHESINNITLPVLKEFYNKYYNFNNIVISITSKQSCKNKFITILETTLQNLYANKPALCTSHPLHNNTNNHLDNPDLLTQYTPEKYNSILTSKLESNNIIININDKAKQTTIVFGFLWKLCDKVYSKILQIILGSLTSSRLFKRLRTDEKLVYSVKSDFDRFKYGSVIQVNTICHTDNYTNVINAIQDELSLLCEGIIDESELKETKEKIINAGKMNIINSLIKSLYYGKEYMYTGKCESYENYIESINSVTLDKVKEEFKQIGKNRKFIVSINT